MRTNVILQAVTVIAVALAGGCAEPIRNEFYTRTPAVHGQWRHGKQVGDLHVGVGLDSPGPGRAFVAYAAKKDVFASVDLVNAANFEELDCQLECSLSFGHSGNNNVHYCLGRLIVNVYTPDHSELLDRVVFFHEGMYSCTPKKRHLTYQGADATRILRELLFDELISYLSG